MSHVPGALTVKRYLNAWRRVSGPTPDPFFSEVLLLQTFDEAANTYTDQSPFANAVSRIGTPAGGTVFAQNNGIADPFGGTSNTLQYSKVAATEAVNTFATNAASQLTNTSDLCVEGWFQFSASSAVATPCIRFDQGVGNPVWGIQAAAPGPSGIEWRFALGSTQLEPGITWNAWHYFAMQYVDADLTVYCSLDGVLLRSLAMSIIAAVSWRAFVGKINTVAPGATGETSGMRAAQLRVTRANRYGNAAAPVPTAPWPLF